MSKGVIIITGTSKGIGLELASHYLGLGYYVAGCSRQASPITHQNYQHFSLDVSNETEVSRMVHSIRYEMGSIDGLINNAGSASMNHLLTTPKSTAEKLFNVNFIGTFLFTREAAKQMKRQKHGRIINFTTVAVPLRLAGEAIYASTKSSIETLTKISAKELSSYGITVNAIGPTPVKTDLIKAIPSIKLNELLDAQAIKRFGEFKDIINVTDFFISKSSDFVTGQIIYLGGVG